jgi:hypothetical protein
MQHSLERRPSRFAPRARVLVVCEGKITEPRYLKDLRHAEQVRLVEIVINDEGGVPKTIVERAVALKRSAESEARRQRDNYLKYDEVWCVFDIDAHPNVQAALQQARANGILTAVSNPCFELWLLLHFQEQFAHLRRDQAQAACRGHIANFEKLVPFGVVHANYAEALNRAIALERWQHEQARDGGNPSTGVHKLTERIKSLGKEAGIRALKGAK